MFGIGVLFAIIAIVLGLIARAQAIRSGQGGAGLALAGVVLGCVALALAVLLLLLFVGAVAA